MMMIDPITGQLKELPCTTDDCDIQHHHKDQLSFADPDDGFMENPEKIWAEDCGFIWDEKR